MSNGSDQVRTNETDKIIVVIVSVLWTVVATLGLYKWLPALEGPKPAGLDGNVASFLVGIIMVVATGKAIRIVMALRWCPKRMLTRYLIIQLTFTVAATIAGAIGYGIITVAKVGFSDNAWTAGALLGLLPFGWMALRERRRIADGMM